MGNYHSGEPYGINRVWSYTATVAQSETALIAPVTGYRFVLETLIFQALNDGTASTVRFRSTTGNDIVMEWDLVADQEIQKEITDIFIPLPEDDGFAVAIETSALAQGNFTVVGRYVANNVPLATAYTG